ncbi:hypothetical protein [Planctomicrobium sp. SH664]|uniref:hypothetical protein n=1 Tax=Planctomicrobium sp. SH664 TaxID=3448125 RepID=UPI003F5AE529
MRRPASRSAFSLLEVIIALGLTVILIAAIFAAIRLQVRFDLAGRGEVAYAQLLRGLIKKVDGDLGSILLALPDPASSTSLDSSESSDSPSSTGGSTSSSSASDSAASTETELPEFILGGLSEGTIPEVFGLYGTPDTLHLTVNRPARELGYLGLAADSREVKDLPPGTHYRNSDLQIVTYAIAPLASTFASLKLQSSRPPVGLGRRSIDLFTFDSPPLTLAPEDVIAAEVTEVQFRYFDGYSWMENWDSRVSNSLPVAVEVTFGFFQQPRPSLSNPNGEGGTVVHIPHVFEIPGAPRVAAEAL